MKMVKKVLLFLIATTLVLVLLAGCRSGAPQPAIPQIPATTTSTAPSGSAQAKVNISGFTFSPGALPITKGTTVTWTNNDSTTHTVTSDAGIWDSGDLEPGKTFSYTFTQPGTFPYHCTIHTSMKAEIVVQ
jgi:plastocyanin